MRALTSLCFSLAPRCHSRLVQVSTGSLVPDSVEEALATSKHTLSVLLPKFNKMLTATKVEGATAKIQEGLLDGIDEALSDASEQMDNLGTWLKERCVEKRAGGPRG